MKRAFDLLASSTGLIVLSPLLAAVALWIWFADGRPVLFGQMRVGRGGRLFRMWKFRSMRVSPGGPALTVGADSRITPVGRVLRSTKIDELPQLWNVLRGEMSLVGPRPELEKYVLQYPAAQRGVLELRPGVTDPASFAFFNEAEKLAAVADPESHYVQVLMPEKLRINLEYAARRNFWTDLLVVLLTVLKPLGIKLDLFALLKMTPPAS